MPGHTRYRNESKGVVGFAIKNGIRGQAASFFFGPFQGADGTACPHPLGSVRPLDCRIKPLKLAVSESSSAGSLVMLTRSLQPCHTCLGKVLAFLFRSSSKRLPVRSIPDSRPRRSRRVSLGLQCPFEQPTSRGNYGDSGGGGSAIDGPPRMASWFESCARRR